MKPLDIVFAILVPLTWGFGIVFAKAALEHFPPLLLMALRFEVTALVMLWFVKPPWHLMRKIIAISFISATLQYGFTYTGVKYLDASTAALIVQLEVPFLVILGAVFLKERPSIRKYLGIVVAFIGVFLISGEPRLIGNHWPIMMVMLGAFLWAIGQIMIRQLGEVGGMTLIAWVALFATPQLFIASIVFEDNHFNYMNDASWVVWAAVVYLGVVMTAFGYSIWYHLLGRYPVNLVGPYLLLVPVFSILGGVTVLDERLTLFTIIGGAIVILGVALIAVEPKHVLSKTRIAKL
ncbi:MAG: EamA family transporter [Pseudomonadota bacterium]